MLADDNYRESDLDTFRLFAGSAGMFGEEATLQFTRAVGSSMARVADAALSLFLVNVEGPLVKEGAGAMPLAEASEEAVELLDVIPSLMGGLFRLHIQAAINRQRIANRSTEDPAIFRLAVGFVDLVGFTPYAQDVTSDELAGFVETFEARANDVVARTWRPGGEAHRRRGHVRRGGRGRPPVTSRLRLVESFGSEAGVSPHAGLSFGPLVARGGDYYGSVVNLASRIADLAMPGEVLVTESVDARRVGVRRSVRVRAGGAADAEGIRGADTAVVGHAIAPCSLSSAIVAGVEAPVGRARRRCRYQGPRVCAAMEPGVRLKRGAGAGCGAPSTSMKVPRATLCGCARASFIVRTGAKHTSWPAKNSTHSSRVRVRNSAAICSFSPGHVVWSICVAGSSVDSERREQRGQLGVELRLVARDRDPLPIGGLVHAVEVRAAVEQVRAPLVGPEPHRAQARRRRS